MKSNLLVFPLFTHDITKEEKRSEKLQGNNTVKVISWSQAQTLDTRAKYKIKITRYLPSLFSSAKGQSASWAKSTSYSVTISTRAKALNIFLAITRRVQHKRIGIPSIPSEIGPFICDWYEMNKLRFFCSELVLWLAEKHWKALVEFITL